MDLGTLLRENRIGYEVFEERRRQEKKWGVQDHPSVLGGTPKARCRVVGLPTEEEAKEQCRTFSETTALTWADIAVEELCEAVAAEGEMIRRSELVQLAAVIVAWIENIDRNTEALQKELTE